MPDLYATIADVPVKTQEMLGDALVVRANDQQMIDMRQRYFSWLDIQPGARALEIGSGTGHVIADLLQSTKLETAVGLDPSPSLVNRAREMFDEFDELTFVAGNGRATDFTDQEFDLVVFHTTLCHIPNPDEALQEAYRVLKPGGKVVVFDGDYAANTAAVGDQDPLQACLEKIAANLIHDKWLCRTLVHRLRNAGFAISRRDAHPYLAEDDAAYFLTLISRGADFMAADGLLNAEGAEMLKAEARSRVEAGSFFGSIMFLSVIAHRPS